MFISGFCRIFAAETKNDQMLTTVLLWLTIVMVIGGLIGVVIGATGISRHEEDGSRELCCGSFMLLIFGIVSACIIRDADNKKFRSITVLDYYVEETVTFRDETPIDTLYDIYYKRIPIPRTHPFRDLPEYEHEAASEYYIEVHSTYHDTIPYKTFYTIYYKR